MAEPFSTRTRGPMSPSAEATGAPGAPVLSSGSLDDELRGARVLLVDDDPASVAVITSVADAHGFELVTASGGARVLEEVRRAAPDTVLLDVMLAGGSGFDLCAALKADPALRSIPVVLVSSLDTREARRRGIAAGCDEFVGKPVDRHALALRLRSLVRLSRALGGRDSAEGVLFALARAVEARDGTNGAHCDRLRGAGRAFGAYLGLSPPDLAALENAGALHDLGKIGVPEQVLAKPGPLSAEEWPLVRSHPVLGATLLAPLRSMQRVVPIVRHHHEAWNGRGYPDGLAGEQIPRLARIFTLLDVFDALRCARPYKPAMPLGAALDVVRAGAVNGRWDPTLVTRFEAWLESSDLDFWVPALP